MIEYMLLQGSSFAADIDQVILIIGVLTGVWFLLTEAMFFWLLWRYRYQEGVKPMYVSGKEKHLKRWINIPHMLIILCDMVVIVAAVRVWYNVKQDMPQTDETVRIVAQQWAWSFQHAGPDGELGTDDDIKTVDELHVELGKTYQFELEARDVMHDFSVPVWRLKQDAIPGRIIRGWFQPTVPGEFDIQCAEMCGIGHGIMSARVMVHTPAEHEAWLAAFGG